MAFHKLMTSGKLEQVPLVGLVRELAQSQRNGVLAVRSGKYSGRICFDGGRVCNVIIKGREDLPPAEVLREMLRWNAGSFDMFYLQWLHPARRKSKVADRSDFQDLLPQLHLENEMDSQRLQLP